MVSYEVLLKQEEKEDRPRFISSSAIRGTGHSQKSELGWNQTAGYT
jgi:hypothetical protein